VLMDEGAGMGRRGERCGEESECGERLQRGRCWHGGSFPS
jgi:hypothetical protein